MKIVLNNDEVWILSEVFADIEPAVPEEHAEQFKTIRGRLFKVFDIAAEEIGTLIDIFGETEGAIPVRWRPYIRSFTEFLREHLPIFEF